MFPLFGALPYDLRFEIWKCCMQPQLVQFHIAYGQHYTRYGDSPWKHIFPRSRPVPSVLQVSRESRQIALAYYTLGLSMEQQWEYRNNGPRNNRRNKLCLVEEAVAGQIANQYWNPQNDAIMLRHSATLPRACGLRSMCQRRDITMELQFDQKIRTLVAELDSRIYLDPIWLCRLPGLELVIVVVNWDKTQGGPWDCYDIIKDPSLSKKQFKRLPRGSRLDYYNKRMETQWWPWSLERFPKAAQYPRLNALKFLAVESLEDAEEELRQRQKL